MPLYEYVCPVGHRFEALQRKEPQLLRACHECGAPAARTETHLVAFAVAGGRGERVSHYLEAAEEVEDKAGRSDDPAVQRAARELRPAYYRAHARLFEEGKNAHWNPQTDAVDRAHLRSDMGVS